MMAAILNSAMLNSDTAIFGFRHLVIFSQIHSKTLLLYSDSDSNLFILTLLDDGSHLEFCHVEYGHLGFSHLSISSETHSHLLRLVPNISTKKNFTHSFWLNLMMTAFLNSAMLKSDTAILDSDTLLSSLRFTQKHSYSTLTLTQTNSIWLKLIHSHLTWWWQPSVILTCWIQTLTSWIQTPCYPLSDSLKNTLTPLWCWLKLIQSDSNWFILT